MRVEVINTGTELLIGHVQNTHVKYLAEALFPLGLRIQRQTTVPDGPAIREALQESFARAEIVFVTGGLGPTTDDITRDVVAQMLGLELVHDEEIMTLIRQRFERRGVPMSERVALQAQRPREAVVLPNDNGTAPGLYLAPMQVAGRLTPHLFLLPGPPRELHPMFEKSALPILQKVQPPGSREQMRNWRIAGVGESVVEDLVGAQILSLGLELGYCARPAEVDLRVIGSEEQLAVVEKIVVEKLGPHIVSDDRRSLEKVVVDLLAERAETLAIAESCTGGWIANQVTNVSGASAVFVQGFVTYANEAKTNALGVPAALLQAHGAVSREVAQAMADGARRAAGVDHALATTGIAGPEGGTDAKPVGTVYIALSTRLGTNTVAKHRFPTDRETFKMLTANAALDLLRRTLTSPLAEAI